MTPQPLAGGVDIVGAPSCIREDQMHIWEVGGRKCPFQMEKAVCVNKEQLEYEAVRTSAQVAQVGTTHTHTHRFKASWENHKLLWNTSWFAMGADDL